MRWLFLLLLTINVAYMAWEINKSPGIVPHKEATASSIPPLVLISEMALPKNALVEPEKKQDKVEVSEQNAPVVSGITVDVDVATVEKDSVEVVSEVKPVVSVIEQPATTADACYTLGPFRELDELRVFTRQIKDYVAEVSFRSREEQEVSLYWVYLAAESDLVSVQKVSKRLISKNIKDYYIITSGEHKNGISLGHFKEKDRASSHASRLKKLGFNPVVETVFKSYMLYWLDYKQKPSVEIPSEVFEKFMTDRMNKLNRECV